MLFPRSGGHLISGQVAATRRTQAAPWLWLLAVLLAHAGLLWLWRQHLALELAPVPRLHVALVQSMRLVAPPASSPVPPRVRQLGGRQKAAIPPGTPALPGLEPVLGGAALAELPALNEPADADLAAEPVSKQPGPEWPLSMRLRYRLTGQYQGPVHGDAEVEWLRQGDRYQMRLRVSIGPRLAPFMSRELVSSGRLTADGIRPERYDEDTRILFGSKRRLSLRLEGSTLQLANGRQLLAPEGVQDSASQFVQLAWWLITGRHRAEAGQVIELPLALPFALRAWRYEVVERVELETPLGRRAAWHLRPQGVDATGALLAQVWLAPELQYLPLRIRIEQGADTWVELTLQEPPLQEAAPVENGASQASKLPPP